MKDELDSLIDDAITENSGEAEEVLEEEIETEVEEEEGESEESEDETEAEEVEETQEEEPEPEEDNIPIPSSLRAEAKEAFKTAPKVLKEDMNRVLLDAQRYITRVGEEASQLRREKAVFDNAVAPFRELIEASNQSDPEVVSTMLMWDAKFRQDPINALTLAAQRTGIDLQQFAYQILNGAVRIPDPSIIDSEQQILRLQNQITSDQNTRQSEAENAMLQEVEAFFSESDANGNLLRPYVQDPEVSAEITRQARMLKEDYPNANPREILAEAYNRATRISDKVQADIRRLEKEQREKQRKIELAKKAKKQAKVIPSSPVKKRKSQSIDDVINEAIEMHS